MFGISIDQRQPTVDPESLAAPTDDQQADVDPEAERKELLKKGLLAGGLLVALILVLVFAFSGGKKAENVPVIDKQEMPQKGENVMQSPVVPVVTPAVAVFYRSTPFIASVSLAALSLTALLVYFLMLKKPVVPVIDEDLNLPKEGDYGDWKKLGSRDDDEKGMSPITIGLSVVGSLLLILLLLIALVKPLREAIFGGPAAPVGALVAPVIVPLIAVPSPRQQLENNVTAALNAVRQYTCGTTGGDVYQVRDSSGNNLGQHGVSMDSSLTLVENNIRRLQNVANSEIIYNSGLPLDDRRQLNVRVDTISGGDMRFISLRPDNLANLDDGTLSSAATFLENLVRQAQNRGLATT